MDKKPREKNYTLCAVLLILAVLAADIAAVSTREGYHMDEILSYQLANSEFTPWITPVQPEGRLEKFYREMIRGNGPADTLSRLFAQAKDVLTRRGASVAAQYKADLYEEPQWMSADDFTDYVTYDSEDSVPVLSPYYNSTTDNHPPVYFILMNLISIFVGEHLSPWPGTILNLIFLLLSLLMILRLFGRVYERPGLGIAAGAMYGLSLAGFHSVMLIRMYMMVAFWCLTVLTLCLEKLKKAEDADSPFRYGNKALIWATTFGFLTQYFFCFFMFFLALWVLARLLLMKRGKDALYFLRSLGFSALAGLVLYPFAFHDLLHTDRGVEALGALSGGWSALLRNAGTFGRILIRETLGGWWGIGLVGVLVLLLITLKAQEHAWSEILLPVYLLGGYFLVVSLVAPYQVDRYLMPAMPMVAIFFVLLCDAIVRRFGEILPAGSARRAHWPLILLLGVILVLPPVITNFFTMEYSFVGYEAQRQISADYADRDCLCVHPGYGFYRNVPEMMNYRHSLILKEEELTSRAYDERIVQNTELILICGNGVDRQAMLEFMSSWYGYADHQTLLENGVYGDTVFLLQKVIE